MSGAAGAAAVAAAVAAATSASGQGQQIVSGWHPTLMHEFAVLGVVIAVVVLGGIYLFRDNASEINRRNQQ